MRKQKADELEQNELRDWEKTRAMKIQCLEKKFLQNQKETFENAKTKNDRRCQELLIRSRQEQQKLEQYGVNHTKKSHQRRKAHSDERKTNRTRYHMLVNCAVLRLPLECGKEFPIK